MNILSMKLIKMNSLRNVKSKIPQKWYWSILPLLLISAFFLFSFRPTVSVDTAERNISFELNGQNWVSEKIADASIVRSEQTKSIFAKTLNINGLDANGSSIALTVFDVQAADIGKCLTTGKYYGQEHEQVNKNFTLDIGVASFSNQCKLIYQTTDGKLISSRNGFVNIDKCENGKVSATFEFKTDSGEIFSKGKIIDVAYSFSE